jgi:hypothetical protein
VTASSAATAAAIARAEATGRAGTLVQYQPATDSWVQIGTVAAKPLSALSPLQPGAAKCLEDSAEDIGAGVDFVFEIGVSVFG